MSADTLTTSDVSSVDTDEPEEAHYCRKEDVARAYVTGEAIQALCGKTWVPSRNPEGLPVCNTCKEIVGQIGNSGSN